jgi:hypothetical protein
MIYGSPTHFQFFENNYSHAKSNFIHSTPIKQNISPINWMRLWSQFIHAIKERKKERTSVKE